MTVIKGKVVNHNESFISEISFDEKINQIRKISKFEDDIFIIPGFIDLHCHPQDTQIFEVQALDGVTTTLELEVGTSDIEHFYSKWDAFIWTTRLW